MEENKVDELTPRLGDDTSKLIGRNLGDLVRLGS